MMDEAGDKPPVIVSALWRLGDFHYQFVFFVHVSSHVKNPAVIIRPQSVGQRGKKIPGIFLANCSLVVVLQEKICYRARNASVFENLAVEIFRAGHYGSSGNI